MLIITPLADCKFSIKFFDNIIGAKKLTLKTFCHKSTFVSLKLSLLLSLFFGDIAALFISALTGLPSNNFFKYERINTEDIYTANTPNFGLPNITAQYLPINFKVCFKLLRRCF